MKMREIGLFEMANVRLASNMSTNPLLGQSLEALLKIKKDILGQNQAHIRAQKMISGHLTTLNEAIRIKEASEKVDDIIVTDHAIVRWLERVEGVDLDRVRAEIRRIINSGYSDPKSDQNVFIDEQTVAVVVTRRDRTAVTVLDKNGPIPDKGELSMIRDRGVD
jgi:hypothetical protein